MNGTYDFSEIAPYRDNEVKKVLEELKNDPSFMQLLRFMNLDHSPAGVERLFEGIETVDAFQQRISKPWLMHFFHHTTTGITHDGIDELDKHQKHLYISNHRDIVLDSAILNVLFSEYGIQSVETAIGDNLLKSPLVKKLTKLNKNFTVTRSAGSRETYRLSLVLSAYIRKKITGNESSIWIAQREGRAKDGNDKTQQGVIKMLNLSNPGNFEDGCRALQIRPLSLSYEYDPCDRDKVREILATEAGQVYVKEPDEDFNNIIAGFLGHKGRVHLSVQPVLKNEIDQLAKIPALNDKIKKLTEMIDQAIYRGYRLFENNYIASDLLHDTSEWQSFYNPEKKREFEDYAREVCRDLPSNARKILFRKYAYPLINRLSTNDPASLEREP